MRFRKIASSIVFSLAISYLAHAQLPNNIRFGFNLSPTVSWLSPSVNKAKSDGILLGVKLRTMVEYYLSENYVLYSGFGLAFNQGGALVYPTGGKILTGDFSDKVYYNLPDNSRVTYKLQYLEIPLGFRMRTKEIGSFRYTFQLPVFTLGLRMKARGNISGPDIPSTKGENFSDVSSFFNFSYGFGAGMEYSYTEDLSFMFGLKYQQGVVDITDEASNNIKVTMGAIELQTGILF